MGNCNKLTYKMTFAVPEFQKLLTKNWRNLQKNAFSMMLGAVRSSLIHTELYSVLEKDTGAERSGNDLENQIRMWNQRADWAATFLEDCVVWSNSTTTSYDFWPRKAANSLLIMSLTKHGEAEQKRYMHMYSLKQECKHFVNGEAVFKILSWFDDWFCSRMRAAVVPAITHQKHAPKNFACGVLTYR